PLLASDRDSAFLVDLVPRHLGPRPGVFSLGKRHRSKDGDLDGVLRQSGGGGGEDGGGRCDEEPTKHGDLSGLETRCGRGGILAAPLVSVESPLATAFRTSKSATVD